eukprot:5013520-Prymnesium_polylepis.1
MRYIVSDANHHPSAARPTRGGDRGSVGFGFGPRTRAKLKGFYTSAFTYLLTSVLRRNRAERELRRQKQTEQRTYSYYV